MASPVLMLVNSVNSTVCKTVRPMLSDRCPLCLSVLSVTLVYCGQTVGWITMPTWYEVRPQPRPHCVGWGASSPTERGTSSRTLSQFTDAGKPESAYINSGPCLLRPNGWMNQDATWEGRPRPRRHCVRWGPSSPLPTERGMASPHTFWPTLLWHGRPSQQLLSSCLLSRLHLNLKYRISSNTSRAFNTSRASNISRGRGLHTDQV